MLMINDIFTKTWGGTAPLEEFWPEVIARVRQRHPNLLFVAEAYWDLEAELQHQGFDHCYDKRLYDRLVNEGAESVRAHLQADIGYQRRLVRFLENHDEPRAAAVLPGDRERAAAVAVATLPGATLWHDGEFEGRRVHLPVFLARRPDEPVDSALQEFSERLVAAAADVRQGEWQLLECTGWPDNETHRNLLAWSWTGGDSRHVLVVNYSDQQAEGRVRLPWNDLAGRSWELAELLDSTTYERNGDELMDPGLYVDLAPWHWHMLSVR
jgi:hypothetical protein